MWSVYSLWRQSQIAQSTGVCPLPGVMLEVAGGFMVDAHNLELLAVRTFVPELKETLRTPLEAVRQYATTRNAKNSTRPPKAWAGSLGAREVGPPLTPPSQSRG